MYKLVLVLLLALFANAKELVFQEGQINAHTEVFGDSTIDPKTNNIVAHLTREDSIESIRGYFEIETLTLISDNKERDKHMYETLKATESPKISFKIDSIKKIDEGYEISGILYMNHVGKPISSIALIKEDDNSINISGLFSIKLTDFKLEPPRMFFLTVRDQIDIKYNFTLKKG